MLILTRKPDERIIIGEFGEITVEVLEVSGNVVRLGITAPREIPIHRGEIHARLSRDSSDGSVGPGGRANIPVRVGVTVPRGPMRGRDARDGLSDVGAEPPAIQRTRDVPSYGDSRDAAWYASSRPFVTRGRSVVDDQADVVAPWGPGEACDHE